MYKQRLMNRIKKSHLLVIDEVGYLPISAMEGNLFFQLISELQEQTSIIITTNKGFEEWAEFLDDKLRDFKEEMEENYRLMERISACKEVLEENPENVTEG